MCSCHKQLSEEIFASAYFCGLSVSLCQAQVYRRTLRCISPTQPAKLTLLALRYCTNTGVMFRSFVESFYSGSRLWPDIFQPQVLLAVNGNCQRARVVSRLRTPPWVWRAYNFRKCRCLSSNNRLCCCAWSLQVLPIQFFSAREASRYRSGRRGAYSRARCQVRRTGNGTRDRSRHWLVILLGHGRVRRERQWALA